MAATILVRRRTGTLDGRRDLANQQFVGGATMIRTLPGWGADMLTQAYRSITSTSNVEGLQPSSVPEVRRIDLDDLRWALARGWEDFCASRSDVMFLCVLYPLLGLLLARLAFGYEMMPQVFPSPSFAAIAVLGVALLMMFLFWLVIAQLIYMLTLGPQPPVSLGAFAH